MTNFKTIERQKTSISPSQSSPHFPELAKLALPHINSFNNIFSTLLPKAVSLLKPATVFDSNGNKIECTCF